MLAILARSRRVRFATCAAENSCLCIYRYCHRAGDHHPACHRYDRTRIGEHLFSQTYPNVRCRMAPWCRSGWFVAFPSIEAVHATVMSTNGQWILTNGHNTLICFRDAEQARRDVTCRWHDHPNWPEVSDDRIYCICFAPDQEGVERKRRSSRKSGDHHHHFVDCAGSGLNHGRRSPGTDLSRLFEPFVLAKEHGMGSVFLPRQGPWKHTRIASASSRPREAQRSKAICLLQVSHD